jgi:hypothetical protein
MGRTRLGKDEACLGFEVRIGNCEIVSGDGAQSLRCSLIGLVSCRLCVHLSCTEMLTARGVSVPSAVWGYGQCSLDAVAPHGPVLNRVGLSCQAPPLGAVARTSLMRSRAPLRRPDRTLRQVLIRLSAAQRPRSQPEARCISHRNRPGPSRTGRQPQAAASGRPWLSGRGVPEAPRRRDPGRQDSMGHAAATPTGHWHRLTRRSTSTGG